MVRAGLGGVAPHAEGGLRPVPSSGCKVRGAEPACVLAVFFELETMTGEYRDVGDRIARLSRTPLGG